MDVMKIYNNLPLFAQNFACYWEGSRIVRTRYGKQFWKKLAEYEERASWSYEKLCEFRDKQLRRLINHSYQTVPYYRDLFHEGGINPEEIRYIDDLKRLPILTKDIIKSRPDDFVSSSIDRKSLVSAHTSGTTGNGFRFSTTQESVCEQWAVWWRYRRALGIKFEEWCALLGGRNIVPINREKPPFYRWNKPCRQMYFSTYHMRDANLKYYLKAIEENKINWIHGYPSAINLLADYILQNDQRCNIEFITTGAENLLESQKDKIRKAFGHEAYQHYGLSEGTANFSEQKDHTMVVDEDFAAVEFLENGNGSYSIVGSNLTNYAMPFIRYSTGDICEYEEKKNGRVITSLDGRKEDYLVTANGTKVGRLDHIFKDMINVREAQFVQKKPGIAELRIIRGAAYGVEDEKKLREEIDLRLKDVEIAFLYVDEIKRTKNGKFRFVVSE